MKKNKNPTLIEIRIGKKIRFYRERDNITQKQLGKYLGVCFQQIEKYENIKSSIGATNIYKLSVKFKIPINAFFYDKEPARDENDSLVMELVGKFQKLSSKRKKAVCDLLKDLEY